MQYLNNWIIILIFGFDIIGKNIAFRFRKRKDMFFPFLLQYIIFNQTEIGIYDDGINCIVFDVRTDSQYDSIAPILVLSRIIFPSET